jgi:hypothetical protein
MPGKKRSNVALTLKTSPDAALAFGQGDEYGWLTLPILVDYYPLRSDILFRRVERTVLVKISID